MIASTESRRWFQEPMVLMVVAIPLTAVIVGLSLLAVSIATWDGTVVDDYYRQGKEINRLLARDDRARALNLDATLNLDASTWILDLTGNSTDMHEKNVELRFVHPTRSGQDVELTLAKTGPGRFRGVGRAPGPGQWTVHLETPRWRLHERTSMPVTQIRLRPTQVGLAD